MDLFAQNIYKVIKNTGVKTVILHSVFGLEKKISLEEGAPQPRLFQEILASTRTAEEPAVQVSSGDVAVLQYTSGSTGAPKAATLTHSNIVASVLQSDHWMGIENVGNAAVMCVIPFFHVFDVSLSPALCAKDTEWYFSRIDLMDMLS
jgi:long-chain acyl-CoA synthetase